MALFWPQKVPDAVQAYGVDWTTFLAGDQIVTSVFTFAADLPTNPLINSQSHTVSSSSLVLSGGTAGLTVELLCSITTAAGAAQEVAIFLPIVDPALTTPSTSLKGLIVNQAFSAMGLADYEFNVTPEEYQSALASLDMLCAELQGPGNNLALNYNFPAAIGTSNLADPSGVPDYTVNAVALTLAVRVAPVIGKSLPPECRLSQQNAMTALRAALTTIPGRLLQRGTPRGAGQKPWGVWWPFGFNGGAEQ